jgi:chromosome segregation ATPase
MYPVLAKMKVRKMAATQVTGSDRRHEMIAEAAYFRAERRGFDGGDPLIDWMEAEAAIDAMLGNPAGNRFVDRLEEQVATASKRLKALKKKIGGMKAEARKEWQQDAEKLAELKDSLETRLEEVRERGEHASRKAQKQAEKIWAEISEIIHRTTSRR